MLHIDQEVCSMFRRVRRTGLSLVAAVMSLVAAAGVWAQGKKPASLAELAAYSGADREQRLFAGAKAEGKVV
jgi:hypothetical protein